MTLQNAMVVVVLMQGTKYMISLTYNCPTSEFSAKDGFFDGLSLDEANIATHKTFQFCGAQPLETYSVHDIFKAGLDMDSELEKFTKAVREKFHTYKRKIRWIKHLKSH